MPDPFDEDGKLKPNVRYDAGEFNYHYETDDLGRICHWDTENLQLTEREGRLPHDRFPPGKIPFIDHAGHLAGDRFGGSNHLDNIVAQAAIVNLSSYKKLENKWAKKIKAGKQVTVYVDVLYRGDNMRPTGFAVVYTINGEEFEKNIPNY